MSGFSILPQSGKSKEGMESTPHSPRHIDDTVAGQFKKQFTDIAERELVRSFGFDKSSIAHVGSLVDDVADAIIEKITKGGWLNGTPIAQLIRNELFIRLGGRERVRTQVMSILLDADRQPTKIALNKFADTVTNRAIQDFVTDTSTHPHPLSQVVHERVAIALRDVETVPKKHPTDTDADIVTDMDTADVDAKSLERKARKNITSLRESPEEQNRRCANLMVANEMIEISQEAQAVVFDLVKGMLSSHFPPEMFNVTQIDDLGLSSMQLNDVAVNFLFWAIDKHSKLTRDHAMVVYLILFRGMDAAQIEEVMKIYGAEDKTDYGFTAQKTMSLYDEVQRVIVRNMPSLFDDYLAKFNPNDSSNRACIANYDEIAANVRHFIGHAEKDFRGARSIGSVYSRIIEIPETEYEKTFEEIDVILLQHGNLTARNRTLVRILRLIGSIASGAFGAYWMRKAGCVDESSDLFQAAAETVMTKLVKFDPTRNRMSTYISWWIRQSITRYVTEGVLVREPVHVHEIASSISRHPEMSDEEIADRYGMGITSIERIRKATPTYRKMVWADEPTATEDGDGDARGDFIQELHTRGDLQFEAVEQNAKRQLVRAVMALMPTRDATVLRGRLMEDRTLEDVGKELGLTRERIRQIEANILRRVKAHPDNAGDSKPTASKGEPFRPFQEFLSNEYFVLLENTNKFKRWLGIHFADDVAKRVVRMWLGISIDNNEEVHRMEKSKIMHALRRDGVYIVEKELRPIIGKVRHLLWPWGSAGKAGLRIISKDDAYAEVRELLARARD